MYQLWQIISLTVGVVFYTWMCTVTLRKSRKSIRKSISLYVLSYTLHTELQERWMDQRKINGCRRGLQRATETKSVTSLVHLCVFCVSILWATAVVVINGSLAETLFRLEKHFVSWWDTSFPSKQPPCFPYGKQVLFSVPIWAIVVYSWLPST